jgi:hypothetical protein
VTIISFMGGGHLHVKGLVEEVETMIRDGMKEGS